MAEAISQTPSRPGRPVVNNIQVLRALAALLVVESHLDQASAPAGLPHFGASGVDIFFVISGFIMVFTTRNRPISGLDFMVARLLRIAPLYWLVTTWFAAQSWFTHHVYWTVTGLIKSYLFIPYFNAGEAPGVVRPVAGVGWTLNLEIFFYAVFAVGLLLPRYVWGIIFTTAVLATLTLIGLHQGADPARVVSAFYTDSIVLEFAFGMALAMLIDKVPHEVSNLVKVGAWIVAFAALATLVHWNPEPPYRGLLSGIPALCLVTSAVCLERWGTSITFRPLIALGNASYSLYLIHYFVISRIMARVSDQITNQLTAIMILVGVIGCCWISSLGFYYFLEKPLSNATHRLMQSFRKSKAVTNGLS